MKILSLECSATPASVAVIEDDKLIASSFVNVRLTHSQTLMPMVENTLKSAKLNINDIDGFSISNGPGSFTGVRIGISAVKGLAAPENIPCVAVSTLSAMAQNFIDTNCYICAVMDARCNQVYNALFEINGGVITRLCDDRALLCNELAEEVKTLSQKAQKSIIIVGDGTDIFYPFVEGLEKVQKSSPQSRYQNAASVGFCSIEDFNNNKTITAKELLPFYLRLPQAERELKAKEERK